MKIEDKNPLKISLSKRDVYMPIVSRDCYFISTDKPMLAVYH